MATTTEKKGFLKKLIGVSGASIAKGVSDTVGGGKLTDYVGSKIAKMRAPADQKKYVEDRTSGKDALKSLGSVALTVAPMGAAVGALRMARGFMNAKKGNTMMKLMANKKKAGDVWKNQPKSMRRASDDAFNRAEKSHEKFLDKWASGE